MTQAEDIPPELRHYTALDRLEAELQAREEAICPKFLRFIMASTVIAALIYAAGLFMGFW